MSIIDFSVPFELTTSEGTVWFNADSSGDTGADAFPRWQLVEEECQAGPGVLRDSTEDAPMSDGSILDEQLTSGMEIVLAAWPWRTAGEPACGAELESMWQEMMRAIRALQSAADDTRLIWTPAGENRRMCEDIQIADLATSEKVDLVQHVIRFGIRSPYPYNMDETEVSTALVDGVPTVITNPGTAPFWPVFRIDGPATAFSILHAEAGLTYDYDGAGLPDGASVPGSTYVEIDMFRGGTAFLANLASRMASINWQTSNRLPLNVGDNTLEVTGASGIVLWNPAWA